MTHTWRDIKHTLEHFIKAPQEIGAIVPSSRFLARKMLEPIDLSEASCIVELGAGTGAITNEMIRRSGRHSRILILDLNVEAVNLLRERVKMHGNVEVIHSDARELEKILSARGISSVAAIVSSLPYASLGNELTREILSTAARNLSPQGQFVAFQYTPLLRKTFEQYFEILSSRIELRNLPPAIVYNCVSKRTQNRAQSDLKSA